MLIESYEVAELKCKNIKLETHNNILKKLIEKIKKKLYKNYKYLYFF